MLQDFYDKIENELGIVLTGREQMIANKAFILAKESLATANSVNNSDFVVESFTTWCSYGDYHNNDFYHSVQDLAKEFDVKAEVIHLGEAVFSIKQKHRIVARGNKRGVQLLKKGLKSFL